jgi:hypothetical protein
VAPTKTRALDTAIELVGTECLRALTHARVALFMEAGYNPAIRVAVSRGHALMEAWAVSVLA